MSEKISLDSSDFKVICLFNNLDKEIVVPIKIVH